MMTATSWPSSRKRARRPRALASGSTGRRDGAALGAGAGLVDAAVRADEPVAGLGDQHGADLADDALRLLQDELDDAWLLLPTLRELLGEGGGRDGIEIDGAPLGLGDDLGGDDDDVATGDGFAGGGGGIDDHRGEIVALGDLREALDGNNGDSHCDAPQAPAMRMLVCVLWTRLRLMRSEVSIST